MTYLEIYNAIVDITRAKCAECKERLDSIPNENATERKALQVELGMYTLCGNAGLLFNTKGDGRGVIQNRRSFLNNVIGNYPKLNELYRTVDEDESLRFIAAIQGELYIRDQWLTLQYAEFAEAEKSGDTKKVFEFRIKIGAVKNMFAAWEAWRKENNVYPDLFEEEDK